MAISRIPFASHYKPIWNEFIILRGIIFLHNRSNGNLMKSETDIEKLAENSKTQIL